MGWLVPPWEERRMDAVWNRRNSPAPQRELANQLLCPHPQLLRVTLPQWEGCTWKWRPPRLTQVEPHLGSSPWNLRRPATDTSEEHNLRSQDSVVWQTQVPTSYFYSLSLSFVFQMGTKFTGLLWRTNEMMSAHFLEHNIHFIKSNSCGCLRWSTFM